MLPCSRNIGKRIVTNRLELATARFPSLSFGRFSNIRALAGLHGLSSRFNENTARIISCLSRPLEVDLLDAGSPWLESMHAVNICIGSTCLARSWKDSGIPLGIIQDLRNTTDAAFLH
jgi:hypothetical protein